MLSFWGTMLRLSISSVLTNSAHELSQKRESLTRRMSRSDLLVFNHLFRDACHPSTLEVLIWPKCVHWLVQAEQIISLYGHQCRSRYSPILGNDCLSVSQLVASLPPVRPGCALGSAPRTSACCP